MLFDSSVRKELARSFGATLVVILTIVMTMMLIRTLGLAANGSVSPQDVALVLGFNAAGQLPLMLALSLFVAVVLSLGRMYRDSEMAIWFSAGVGLGRFIRPVLRMAWPIYAGLGVLVLIVWPWVNQQTAEIKTRYEQRSDLSRVAPGAFQSSSDGSRVFFIERNGDTAGVARNVFLLTTKNDTESVTTAHSGHIENSAQGRTLVLDVGHRNEHDAKSNENNRMQFERFRLLVDDKPAPNPSALPAKAIDTLGLLLDPTPANMGELTWRMGLLLGGINLSLLGIGAAATNPRRPGNWNLLLALLGFLIYFNLVNLSQAWVTAGKVHVVPTLLILHGLTLAAALALIWWRDHATVTSWRARRTASQGAQA